MTPRTVIDTLSITAAPVPLTMALSPLSRNAAAQVNTAAPGDNAAVTLAGDNSTTTAWTAAKRKAWTTLTTASGTGSGTVAWSRSTTGLAVGTYVDTITVTVAGVTPRTRDRHAEHHDGSGAADPGGRAGLEERLRPRSARRRRAATPR